MHESGSVWLQHGKLELKMSSNGGFQCRCSLLYSLLVQQISFLEIVSFVNYEGVYIHDEHSTS
jgi:hypothetical protein